ncbi:MAG: adenylate/guanylate cyclase domain-containing protein [Candidatus Methylacidiphilales bacterium]
MNTPIVTPTVSDQIIAFADLHGFHRCICAQLNPEETFSFLSEYYAAVQAVMEGSEGKIIKWMGDAALLSFPASSPDGAIHILRTIKSETDLFLARKGHKAYMCIKAHVGLVAMGSLGNGEWARLDICGLAVNQTALLPHEEWVLSDELKKKMGS